MTYKTILFNYYYLLISTDGHLNEKEIAMWDVINSTEELKMKLPDNQFTQLATLDRSMLQKETLLALKKLDRHRQVRTLAWLTITANADGFMDRREWQFIYTLYQKELNLNLEEIMQDQKKLSKVIRDKNFFTGVSYRQVA